MPIAHAPHPFTMDDLIDLDLPTALARRLSNRPLEVQIPVIRILAGLPVRPTVAFGLTVSIDQRDTVLTICWD